MSLFVKGFHEHLTYIADHNIVPAVLIWCATRQEDSEKSKSSVPPVVHAAGGILMPPNSIVHDIRLVSSNADFVGFVRCYST